MSGRWVRIYDPKVDRWLEMYLDEPLRLARGTATTLNPDKMPEILAPDGRPIRLPRQIGFRPQGKPR